VSARRACWQTPVPRLAHRRLRCRGKFVGGLRSGYGTALFPNGTSYAGDWQEDKQHGKGVLRLADGREVHAQWLRGVLQQQQPTAAAART
jgi:hypothetical protein